jgi:hypothetical protein
LYKCKEHTESLSQEKSILPSLHSCSVALMIHFLFMDQTTTLSDTWEALLHAGTLPVSIVPSAAAFLEVFDMLERGREAVVNDDNVVENNQGDKMPL